VAPSPGRLAENIKLTGTTMCINLKEKQEYILLPAQPKQAFIPGLPAGQG